MNPLLLLHFTATSCIGRGLDATLDALRHARGGLRPRDFERADLDTWIDAVDGVDAQPVRADLADFACRNNRVAQLGLTRDGFDARVTAAVARYGAARVASRRVSPGAGRRCESSMKPLTQRMETRS